MARQLHVWIVKFMRNEVWGFTENKASKLQLATEPHFFTALLLLWWCRHMMNAQHVPEPNQSITVLWQERNNQLNLNKLKFQHKEMFCLNLYVLLQKCTRLTFILQIGLDMQALDQVRLFPLTSLGMLLGKKRYGSAVRKRRQDATRKPSHQAPTQRRSLGSNSISSGERKESQTELLSVIQPKKNKEEWKRHELFKI